ncbi:MAG TPA: hypothetical protein VHA37_01245, partial [Candidatus Saccharimonadales bacterium]|nr:hypothetical protein [Candidatus Saccharimonadales bacterium]
ALIILVVGVAGIISFFVANKLFGSSNNRQQKAAVVQPITADFPKPDSRFFNSQAFDPTQPISIGQNANPNPFSSQQ